jgi:hypothetical protein
MTEMSGVQARTEAEEPDMHLTWKIEQAYNETKKTSKYK